MGSDYAGRLSPDGLWQWDGTRWVPTARSTPAPTRSWVRPTWLRTELRVAPTLLTTAAVAVLALLGDQAIRVGSLGLGASLALVAGAVAVWTAPGADRRSCRALVLLSLPFAAGPALRSSPWLTWPDVATAVGLLLVAVTLAGGGSLLNLGFAEAGRRILNGVAQVSLGLPFAAEPLITRRDRVRGMGPILRGLALALPVAVVLVALLAAGDPIFASFFRLQLDTGQLVLDSLYWS